MMKIQRQAVTPLLVIQNDAFAYQYELGIWSAMHGDDQGKGVYPDSYLVDNLKKDVAHARFDNLDDYIRAHIGFYLGMIHGGILSPSTGQLRTEATTLVTLTHEESKRGYNCGRRASFTELEPHEAIYSDAQTIEWVCDLVHNNKACFSGTDDHLIYWSIGDFLGLLSGQIFPLTPQEQEKWRKE